MPSTAAHLPAEDRAFRLSDREVIARVREGHVGEFEVLMRRYNARTFRIVRSILGDDVEAEDATQEAWVAAYENLARFEGRSAFSTWLGRIAIRCATTRLRRDRRRSEVLSELDQQPVERGGTSPEQHAQRQQLTRVLEGAVDALPPHHRLVVVLRDVEQLDTTEAAQVLGLSEENLRVRLHRARAALRQRLSEDLGEVTGDLFRFDGERCDRMVTAVLARAVPPPRGG